MKFLSFCLFLCSFYMIHTALDTNSPIKQYPKTYTIANLTESMLSLWIDLKSGALNLMLEIPFECLPLERKEHCPIILQKPCNSLNLAKIKHLIEASKENNVSITTTHALNPSQKERFAVTSLR